MIGSVLKTGRAWIAEPTNAPEVVTAREPYTAWHFKLSRKVSTLWQWVKAQAKQDKGKQKKKKANLAFKVVMYAVLCKFVYQKSV
jgi:hypothetical protein